MYGFIILLTLLFTHKNAVYHYFTPHDSQNIMTLMREGYGGLIVISGTSYIAFDAWAVIYANRAL